MKAHARRVCACDTQQAPRHARLLPRLYGHARQFGAPLRRGTLGHLGQKSRLPIVQAGCPRPPALLFLRSNWSMLTVVTWASARRHQGHAVHKAASHPGATAAAAADSLGGLPAREFIAQLHSAVPPGCDAAFWTNFALVKARSKEAQIRTVNMQHQLGRKTVELESCGTRLEDG